MKRKAIHILLIVSMLVGVLQLQGSSMVHAIGNQIPQIMDDFDVVARALIAMDKTTGSTRVNHEYQAYLALERVAALVASSPEEQDLIDLAADGFQQVVDFDGSTAGANHYQILALAMELSDKISSLGYGQKIFSTAGRFIINYKMLSSHISDITFPGTHNSYANDEDAERAFDSLHQNQGLSITRQLENGVRWLDMDLGPKDGIGAVGCAIYFAHGSGTGGYAKMGDVLQDIKAFAKANPEVTIIFNMADVGTIAISDNVGYAYGKLREAIYSTGLDAYIYNMRPSSQKQNNASDVYTTPSYINPTLKDMIGSGKNILFVPHGGAYPQDRDYFKEVHGHANIRTGYQASKLEEKSMVTAQWNPSAYSEQSTDPLRFMSVEFTPDDGNDNPAGSRFFAARNNDGRRLYQLAKWYESKMPNDKHINYFKIDYFMDSIVSGGSQNPVYYDMIRACNTLNQERFGYFGVSNNGDLTVQLTPGNRGQDILRSRLKSEVDTVIWNAYIHQLEKSEWSHTQGSIRANGRRRHKSGSTTLQWWCLPEFAMDGDFSTVWAADGTNAIWFDLGSETDFDHVYIAWEFGMANPGFRILGSHNGSNWDVIYTGGKVKNTNTAFYRATTGPKRYRYIKLETTDVDNEARTGIAEIFVYND